MIIVCAQTGIKLEEIGLFELGRDGALSYRATYHLRSFDYYSSRNYASRLIGRKLIFYSPTLLQTRGTPPLQMMPGVRRWQGPGSAAQFERILPAPGFIPLPPP